MCGEYEILYMGGVDFGGAEKLCVFVACLLFGFFVSLYVFSTWCAVDGKDDIFLIEGFYCCCDCVNFVVMLF